MTLISSDVNSISDLYIYVYILDVSSLECNFKYFHDDAMTHKFKKKEEVPAHWSKYIERIFRTIPSPDRSSPL